MEKNRRILLLTMYILCFILAITAILRVFSRLDGRNIIIHETTLLNPNYASLVQLIELHFENSSEVLDINLSNKGWIGKYSNLQFAVNESKVHEFIKRLSTPVRAEQIYTSTENLVHYNVLDNTKEMKNVVLSGIDSGIITEFSKLNFGTLDYTKSNRYVMSAKNPNIYAVPDVYYSFLQTYPSAWVDPKIIPTMLRDGQLDSTVLSVQINDGTIETILFAGDAIFDNAVQTILTLQSSNVVQAQSFLEKTPQYEITVTYLNRHTVTCAIHSINDGYLIIPESPELLYALQLSKWSFDRLLQSFID